VVEILRGISVGDEVIVGDAARTIAPGIQVRIINASSAP
jgi:hypothetical protein